MVWLTVLFVVPLAVMVVKALETCSPVTGACQMTWHWSEFSLEWNMFHTQFFNALRYAAVATVIDLVVAFPIAYFIAFFSGRRKNFFLVMLLVPFFVSFVIRTVLWQFLLSDSGVVLGVLRWLHLASADSRILGTSLAVVAGMAYNYLPFTALPLYVALERIEPSVLDAAADLYAGRVMRFVKVVVPLCLPGIFAAFLLTFIPALGDYVNQQVLGGISNTMVGTVIQDLFLVNADYPGGSALSVIVMGCSLVGIFAYAKVIGTRSLEEYL
jgi:spermidine/putrescine transport system permease protein